MRVGGLAALASLTKFNRIQVGVLEEFNFVPFEVSPLPAGPWLVFAPHPDDETFGMGGALLLAKRAAIKTHVVVMTDGALGGKQEDLVQRRQGELRRACALLGVASITGLNQSDRSLAMSASLVDQLVKLLGTVEPAAVFFPGPFEPHPDHRATAALVWRALQLLRQDSKTQQSTPLPFCYEISVQSPVNTLLDISPVMPAKREAMAVYASQNAENDYPQLVEGLNKGRSFTLPEQVLFAEGLYRFEPENLDFSLQMIFEEFLARYWK